MQLINSSIEFFFVWECLFSIIPVNHYLMETSPEAVAFSESYNRSQLISQGNICLGSSKYLSSRFMWRSSILLIIHSPSYHQSNILQGPVNFFCSNYSYLLLVRRLSTITGPFKLLLMILYHIFCKTMSENSYSNKIQIFFTTIICLDCYWYRHQQKLSHQWIVSFVLISDDCLFTDASQHLFIQDGGHCE